MHATDIDRVNDNMHNWKFFIMLRRLKNYRSTYYDTFSSSKLSQNNCRIFELMKNKEISLSTSVRWRNLLLNLKLI